MKTFHIYMAEEVLGPFSEKTVVKLALERRIAPHDFAWLSGSKDWKTLETLVDWPKPVEEKPSISVQSPSAAPIQPVSTLEKAVKAPGKMLEKPPTKTESVEAERSYRIPLEATVQINPGGKFEMQDISEGGMAIVGDGTLNDGADIRMKIESPSLAKPLDMTGIVVRHDTYGKRNVYGIEFTKVNPAHRRIILEYIQSRLSKKAA